MQCIRFENTMCIQLIFTGNPYYFGRSFKQGTAQAFVLDDFKLFESGEDVDGLQDESNSILSHYWRLFYLGGQIFGFGNQQCCALTYEDFNKNFTGIPWDLTAR